MQHLAFKAMLWLWGTAQIGVGAPLEEVITEPKPVYLPAGPGQKPFNVTRHIIPLKAIQGGGVPRGGIPALFDPKFAGPEEASRRLRSSDRVIGIFVNGEAKAYPVRILNWHEVVNDTAGGRPILVSW